MKKYAVMVLAVVLAGVLWEASFAAMERCPKCINGKITCEICNGTKRCVTCGGKGTTGYNPDFPGNGSGGYVKCSACGGDGTCWRCHGSGKEDCYKCNGTGFVYTADPLPGPITEPDNDNKDTTDDTSGIVYAEEGYESHGTSEADAWEINSALVLAKVRDDINSGKVNYVAYYKLTSDIDITQYTDWEPIGGGRTITATAQPENKFVGHFDGNGHTVKVAITRRGRIYNTGLFGWIDQGGSIKNLSVSGRVEANSNNLYSHNYVGGIASHLYSGTIENCNFDGTVKASMLYANSEQQTYAGGITGYAGSYEITIVDGCKVGSQSATSISVSLAASNYKGRQYGYEGGVIGRLYNDGDYSSRVTNNSAKVSLSGNCDHSGAIYGYIYGTKGTVSGNTGTTTNAPAPISDDIGDDTSKDTPAPGPNLSEDVPAPTPDPTPEPDPDPDPKPEALNTIAQALGTTPDNVSYISTSDMAAPQAPTSRITNALAALNLDIISTQGSLNVSQSGYYAFPLTVPANLVGTNTELRVYLADRSVFGASSFSPSAITKSLTTAQIFTETGGKVTTLPDTVIAAADLAADTERTFSTHIVKAQTNPNPTPNPEPEPTPISSSGGGCSSFPAILALTALITLRKSRR